MKNVIVSLCMGAGILCSLPASLAQEFKEHVSKEFTISTGTGSGILYIYNINGFIKVEGYAGDKVLLEMDKTIDADNVKNLETGKKELILAYDQRKDTVMAYIAGPFDSRPHRNWQYNDDRPEIEYKYRVDFTVKVPFKMNLHISTVNNGKVSVNNVSGNLHVSNVNDLIIITNATGTTYAHTVNGEVSVTYLENPQEESTYYTVNGDIHVSFKPGLSADLQFKSMHGNFFTDFPNTMVLPPSVTKVIQKNGEGIVYKLNAITSVRFGKGGTKFRFETLNGNIYIKKQS